MPPNGNEGALEECVINDVTLAAFSANHPIPAFYVDKTKVGGDRLRLSALHSVHDHWSRSAINAHNDFGLRLWPTLIYLIVSSIKYVEGICKGIIGFFELDGTDIRARYVRRPFRETRRNGKVSLGFIYKGMGTLVRSGVSSTRRWVPVILPFAFLEPGIHVKTQRI